ncbi:MAG: TIGR04086 family membrane protein [Defluviitaleaceae bacterium]|nr:TIGR04086 family membrane protein [Defluviitaleaceae bacterium]
MNKIKKLSTGVLLAYAVTVFVFLIYSILLTYTQMTEEHLNLTVIITVIISGLIAGVDTARGQKSRGIFWGALAGSVYSALLIVLMYSMSDVLNIARAILFFIISIVTGSLGGVLGINLKKPEYKK